MGRKISLAQARRQQDTRLIIYCMSLGTYCHHTGHMDLDLAISKFGPEKRLDDIRFRCTRCGRAETDVRSDHPLMPGEGRG